ncbi:MAG: DMT family transporter [Desulfobacterales bacterium]|nr:DMT family transporter [Desulfobacterales bacterium]
MPFIGESIALLTVLCWTISVQFFEAASRQVGATSVNIIRLTTALALFTLYLTLTTGSPLPLDFPARAWFYLSLSGIIGFFLGDICLFKALVEAGPRIALLLFSLSAPMAAVIGWAFLDEIYTPAQWGGILITLAGVGMVILEKNHDTNHRQVSFKGLAFGLGAMMGQAVGYILSKAGMVTAQGYLPAFPATQIRALAAFGCFILFFTLTRKWGQVKQALANTQAVAMTAAGSVVGPFIGVSLSLLTLQYLSTGVASTFLSLTPVAIIPFSIFLYKERVSPRAILGAVIAVTGIGLLMLA